MLTRTRAALLLIKLSVENIFPLTPAAPPSGTPKKHSRPRARNDDPYTLANVLSIRHNVLLSHETTDQRRRENQELFEIAERFGDPNLRLYSRTYGYFWRLESGDIEGARADVHEGVEIARRLAQPMFDWIFCWMEAGLDRLDGDLDAAHAVSTSGVSRSARRPASPTPRSSTRSSA